MRDGKCSFQDSGPLDKGKNTESIGMEAGRQDYLWKSEVKIMETTSIAVLDKTALFLTMQVAQMTVVVPKHRME